MMLTRDQVKKIVVGGVAIGGGADISVQSMTNTDTRNVEQTVHQIQALEKAGCQIVRLAVPDEEAARALFYIKEKSALPLVADIHFDYRLALLAAESGVDKIRINPGNIGGEEKVKKVVDCCRSRRIPIRIGVNAGSLQKPILEKYGSATPEALVESAAEHIRLLEAFDFSDICVSIKSSDVRKTVKANMLFRERFAYPLHLGITEAGTEYMGTIKSAAGIGGLLSLGIGETIRVSLTDDPVREIFAAQAILKAVGQYEGVDVVSCPTCGRTQIDLIAIANEVERRLSGCKRKMKVAVMGCAVNGPGEARDADFGIAGGKEEGLIFCKGEILCKVPQNRLVDTLIQVIQQESEDQE